MDCGFCGEKMHQETELTFYCENPECELRGWYMPAKSVYEDIRRGYYSQRVRDSS